MKVIDLLNKIANGEEVPKKIKYGIYYWKYDKEIKDYKDNDDDYVFSCSNYDIIDMLNEEVEIIEEPQEHKIPEKIEYHQVRRNEVEVDYIEDGIVKRFCLNKKQRYFVDKINEILDYLEEIK